MIDLAKEDPRVAAAKTLFDEAQADFNRANAALKKELFQAFSRLCPVRAGQTVVHHELGRCRVVILSNGSDIGVYCEPVLGRRDRFEIPPEEWPGLRAVKYKTKKQKAAEKARATFDRRRIRVRF